MKKLLTLLPIFALTLMVSCTLPSGVDVTQYFSVNNTYSSLYISDGMIVTVSDEVDEVVITADESVMDKIRVENSSGSLRIFRSDFSVIYLNTAEVLIPYNENLKDVEVCMDSEFYTEYGIGLPEYTSKVKVSRSKFSSYVIAKNLDLTVEDESKAYCTYDVENKLNLKIHNNSSVELDGESDQIYLDMKDNAEISQLWTGNYYSCSCYYCSGNMDGNCKAYIDCEDELEVYLYNNSFLYFTSNPDYDGCWWDNTSGLYGN